MNIINYGGQLPERKHPGDAGADLYVTKAYKFEPHQTIAVPLDIGTEIPEGFVGFILPRSSMAARGLVAQAVPVDAGYRGIVHAIITNYNDHGERIEPGDRIAQLVIFPCETPELKMISPLEASRTDRGSGAFGSTGR